MMSFCRKSVHSFLGLSATSVDATATDHHHHHHHNLNPPWKSRGLGLVTATNEIRHRSPNVLESSSMIINKYSSSPPSSPPPPTTRKKDPREIGFIDDIGGGVNGLMSCTESLGFESSDERRIDDDEEDPLSLLGHDVRPWTSRKEEWGKKTSRSTDTVKKFPPPLSSLNRKGQPCFFLRPLRKDGTLQLTEVRIYRPEILRAYRGDGRLRLHLIRHDEDEDEDEDENEKEDEDCINVEEEGHDDDDNIEEGKVAENVMREEEEERNVDGEEWKIPVSSTGEGYRRCYEVVNPHDHHHHVHMWRQHCVTTR